MSFRVVKAKPVTVSPGYGPIVRFSDHSALSGAFVPDVCIVKGQFTWAEIQPSSAGSYTWTIPDAYLANTARPVGFAITTVSGDVVAAQVGQPGYTPPPNTATPSWVLSAVDTVGGLTIGASSALATWPVYWDTDYLSRLETFITAIATRYAGNSRLAFIQIGGYQMESNEANGYGQALQLADFRTQLAAAGWTTDGTIAYNSVYADAVVDIIGRWRNAFPTTELIFTGTFESSPTEFIGRANIAADADDYTLCNTRLNSNDQAGDRTRMAAWKAGGTKVGWIGISNNNGTNVQAAVQGIGAPEQGLSTPSRASYFSLAYQGSGLTVDQLNALAYVYPELEP